MFDPDLDIDARTAAAIAAGMLAVALADGEVHPRELEMIQGFKDAIPDEVDPSGVAITDDAVRRVLVQSLVMVALADGAISEVERATIREISRAHGASDAVIAEVEAEVRRAMFAQLRGASHFRDDALAVAAELGLDRQEAEHILDDDGDDA